MSSSCCIEATRGAPPRRSGDRPRPSGHHRGRRRAKGGGSQRRRSWSGQRSTPALDRRDSRREGGWRTGRGEQTVDAGSSLATVEGGDRSGERPSGAQHDQHHGCAEGQAACRHRGEPVGVAHGILDEPERERRQPHGDDDGGGALGPIEGAPAGIGEHQDRPVPEVERVRVPPIHCTASTPERPADGSSPSDDQPTWRARHEHRGPGHGVASSQRSTPRETASPDRASAARTRPGGALGRRGRAPPRPALAHTGRQEEERPRRRPGVSEAADAKPTHANGRSPSAAPDGTATASGSPATEEQRPEQVELLLDGERPEVQQRRRPLPSWRRSSHRPGGEAS